jgi:hypothetical protein
MTLTRGYGIINHTFLEYRPVTNASYGERNNGVLIATEKGFATPYALDARLPPPPKPPYAMERSLWCGSLTTEIRFRYT